MLPLLATVTIPAAVTADLPDIEDLLGVHPSLTAKSCGYDQAWYEPGPDRITLCAEWFDRPNLARFVLHHELAHAYMYANEIPTGDDEEFLADELGALIGTQWDVAAGAMYFTGLGGAESADDVHPADLDRGAVLACLFDGLDAAPVSRQCKAYARSALAHWEILLLETRWAPSAP